MGLDLQSIAYIDNREFNNPKSPGPLGYKSYIYTSARSLIPNSMFQLGQWLADGLLVSSALSLDTQVPTVGRFPSYIVAAFSTLWTTG